MNLKKAITRLFFVLMASCALCACHPVSDTSPESTADSELPELKIGVDTLKPFFYIDQNGDYAGIDADIATEACRRAGYKPVFIDVSWSERDTYLNSQTVDCLWSAFIMDGREDQYLWTDSYLESHLRAIVDTKSPDQALATLGDRAGMAVRAGSKMEELLLTSSSFLVPIRIYSCGTFAMAETAFIKGYTGALGGHEVVLQNVLDTYPGLYRFLDGSLMTAHLGVAFQKDDTTGHWEAINGAIQEMKEDGTIQTIWDTYTSSLSTEKEDTIHARH